MAKRRKGCKKRGRLPRGFSRYPFGRAERRYYFCLSADVRGGRKSVVKRKSIHQAADEMIDIEVKYSPSDARKRLGGEKFF